MSPTYARSFQLSRDACAKCGSHVTRLDWVAASNLWRVPLAILMALVFAPLVGFRVRCLSCGCSFVAC